MPAYESGYRPKHFLMCVAEGDGHAGACACLSFFPLQFILHVRRKSILNYFPRLTSLLLFVVICPFSKAAEEPLSEVVVTATRTTQTTDSLLSSVTVLTREDIDNSRALTLPDILRSVPGLDITTNGGLGKTTSVFMRGTNSDHVLVLVDGVKIGSATAGAATFEHLPLSHIERIEIVRGPRSSLYGSEAIGGVIQIFTRRGKGKKTNVSLSGGIGEDNTSQLTAGLSGSINNSWYSFYADYLETDGFDVYQGIEPDDDGYDNTSYSARLGHRFGNVINLEVHALRAQGHNKYDSTDPTYPSNNEEDFLQQVFGLKTEIFVNDWWQMILNGGKSFDETDNFGNTAPKSFFHTHRKTASFQNDFLFSGNNILTIGYDYQKDEVGSSEAFAVDSRENHGLFVEYQTQLGSVNLIGGLRQEDNDQFGDHTTGNIALGYALAPTKRFVISYGTAFKAPAFNELYYPNYGNPNIVPEESESVEIGLMGEQANYRWSLNAYRTKIDKLIATNFDPATSKYFADNINKAKIKGIEYFLELRDGGWEFNATASWLKPEDDTTGKILPRRAEKSARVELAERRGRARLGISWLIQGDRYDDAPNTQRLEGYEIWNLAGDYFFDKHWFLRFRVENVGDEKYETARFYNTAGRFWFTSLHYQY